MLVTDPMYVASMVICILVHNYCLVMGKLRNILRGPTTDIPPKKIIEGMHKQFIWQLFSREEFGSIDIRASFRKSPRGGGGGNAFT